MGPGNEDAGLLNSNKRGGDWFWPEVLGKGYTGVYSPYPVMGLGCVVVLTQVLHRLRQEKRRGLRDKRPNAAILAMGEAWK